MNALIGLDAQRKDVRRKAIFRRQVKHHVRRALELDGYLGGFLSQRLARPQVERDLGPAPIVYKQPKGSVGGRTRIGRDAIRGELMGTVEELAGNVHESGATPSVSE